MILCGLQHFFALPKEQDVTDTEFVSLISANWSQTPQHKHDNIRVGLTIDRREHAFSSVSYLYWSPRDKIQ